jgi:hypothetical protein
MKTEIPDEVIEYLDISAIPVVGAYTASSLYNFINLLSTLPSIRPMGLLEAFVQVAVAGFGALGTCIGGVGIILLYKWRHEAAMLKIANEHIVTLHKIAKTRGLALPIEDDVIVGESDIEGIDRYIESLPYGKPTKAAKPDEDTVDLP